MYLFIKRNLWIYNKIFKLAKPDLSLQDLDLFGFTYVYPQQ